MGCAIGGSVLDTMSTNLSDDKNLKDHCTALRVTIARIADELEAVQNNPKMYMFLPEQSKTGQLVPNLVLAYRHLEDARMRLGKVIQAYEGRPNS